MSQPVRRRRGSELEDQILDAALAELRIVGYGGLTMEGVAARAHTGKQVLYRRWHNRPALVLAAIRQRYGSIAEEVPDTGDLRDDVLAVLQRMLDRMNDLGPEVLRGLAAEAFDAEPSPVPMLGNVLAQVLERAAARGEIPTADLPQRVVSLPTNLLRHDLLVGGVDVSRDSLVEIVDDVFLPLVTRRR